MLKVQYIVLASHDDDSPNLVCHAVCDTRKEAREVEKELLRKDDVEFVHIYAGDKIKSLKGWHYGSKS